MFTTNPHPNYPTLNALLDKLNDTYFKEPTKAPSLVFIMKGTFHSTCNNNEHFIIKYPMQIIGAGQNKTTIHGGFLIQATKQEGKRVTLNDMTLSHSNAAGLFCQNCLSVLCDSVTITGCDGHGVYAYFCVVRLINSRITKCGRSGICCRDALVELEGSETKVDRNYTCGRGDNYGLYTCAFYGSVPTTSSIHLLFPLTKENVSTNNCNGHNYGGDGRGGIIKTVDTLKSL
jgi:hypothetical protein